MAPDDGSVWTVNRDGVTAFIDSNEVLGAQPFDEIGAVSPRCSECRLFFVVEISAAFVPVEYRCAGVDGDLAERKAGEFQRGQFLDLSDIVILFPREFWGDILEHGDVVDFISAKS